MLSRIFDQQRHTVSASDIPLIDVGKQREDRDVHQNRRPTWRQGHHFGLRCCLLSVTLVLLFNIAATIVVSSTHQSVDGVNILQRGDCNTTKRLGTGLHLLINILGTILLGASSYCMQCVSAPTRENIDRAHGQGTWLDVGIPSARNLGWISWPRKSIWFLLLISSAPLHLTYNSVVFPSTSIAIYHTYVVTQNYLNSTLAPGSETATKGPFSLRFMDIKECAATMSQVIVSKWKNILVISSDEDDNTPVLDALSVDPGTVGIGSSMPRRIRCGLDDPGLCGDVNRTAGDGCLWAGFEMGDKDEIGEGGGIGDKIPSNKLFDCFPITHCLAEEAAQHCSLRFSIPVMAVVIVCNIIKLFTMMFLVWRSDAPPLITPGDAVASFLEKPGKFMRPHLCNHHSHANTYCDR